MEPEPTKEQLAAALATLRENHTLTTWGDGYAYDWEIELVDDQDTEPRATVKACFRLVAVRREFEWNDGDEPESNEEP